MQTPLWTIIVVLIACIIGSFGPMYLKRASNQLSFNIIKLIKNKNLILGILLYGISTIIFIPTLKYGQLSVLYPLVATSYMWTTLVAVKFLGEKMNRFKWIGIILIIIGVSLIGMGA